MSTITLGELQQNLEAVLGRVEAGERVIVAREGRPIAELSPVTSNQVQPRPFGLAAEQFTVPDDFDAPLPDHVIEEFENQ